MSGAVRQHLDKRIEALGAPARIKEMQEKLESAEQQAKAGVLVARTHAEYCQQLADARLTRIHLLHQDLTRVLDSRQGNINKLYKTLGAIANAPASVKGRGWPPEVYEKLQEIRESRNEQR